MIEPKKRTSKARRDKRRAQTWKIALPGLQACSKCGAPAPSHRVCKACDTYNGRVMKKAAE